MIMGILEPLRLLLVLDQRETRTGNTFAVFVAPGDLVPAAARLLEAGWHLEDTSGLDAREGYLVAHAFAHSTSGERLSLRVLVPHDRPDLPSLAQAVPGAAWHERETRDFYGLNFDGHPNLVPLLLPDDMRERPLRKEEPTRAALLTLMGGPKGIGRVLRKAPDFTLLDPPAAGGEA